MSEYNELKQATKEIEVLKSEIKTLREQTNFVMNKLEKAIEDRIVLRAENFKLKQNMDKAHAQIEKHKRKTSSDEYYVLWSAGF